MRPPEIVVHCMKYDDLHIFVDESRQYFHYTFLHRKTGDAWETLREVAKEILAEGNLNH